MNKVTTPSPSKSANITVIKNHIDKIERSNFSFKETTKPFIVKEIKNLSRKKT